LTTLPGEELVGTSGENYYATLYGYDADGNQNVTVSPQGTISLMVFPLMC
jgi:hypothetical protein